MTQPQYMTAILLLLALSAPAAGELFDPAAPHRQWAEFQADGYARPVAGLVFADGDDVCAGMPLGGLGTGCLDVEVSGVLGFSSIFMPSMRLEPLPYQTLRNPQLLAPFLGLSIGGQTWVLASQQMVDGGSFAGCIDPVDPGEYTKNAAYMQHWRVEVPKTENVKAATAIRYWGHYPVVDMEYETDAPVSVGLRAWATFIPGDATASATPGAVFEVHLSNSSKEAQSGVIAFNFPGATRDELGGDPWSRREEAGSGYRAAVVRGDRAQYAVAALDEPRASFGGNLCVGGSAWANISKALPSPKDDDAGISSSVSFQLAPGESRIVRFVLAWWIPHWQGGAYDEIKHFDETWTKNDYTLARTARTARAEYRPFYLTKYDGPTAVIEDLAATHRQRLARIIKWQQAVYDDRSLPVWLRAALVDNLSQFAEDSIWALPEGELARWAAPLGAFQMVECPRTCAVVGCIASNFYGDIPITYFFPELERQILRGYVAYMRPDGAVPFLYPANDFAKPAFEWQVALNGACFADLVHRLWLRTGDDGVVREFYPAVKKSTQFTVDLAPGPYGLISFPREGKGQEWWEHTPVYGMVTHLAGVRIAQLHFAERMAASVGDDEFSRKCKAWIEQSQELLEQNLWDESIRSYVFYSQPENGRRSDDIMSSQLDGQWMMDFHGLQPAFRQDRIAAALDTIQRTCLVDVGVAGFAEPGKGPDLARYGTFPPEVAIVAMTYMYQGQRSLGLEIARRSTDNIVRVQGLGWDLPNLIRCDTGARTYGADYYQNMILWGLPAAMAGQDLTGPCRDGGLVKHVLDAADEPRR